MMRRLWLAASVVSLLMAGAPARAGCTATVATTPRERMVVGIWRGYVHRPASLKVLELVPVPLAGGGQRITELAAVAAARLAQSHTP